MWRCLTALVFLSIVVHRAQSLQQLKSAEALESYMRATERALVFYFDAECMVVEERGCAEVEELLDALLKVFPGISAAKCNATALDTFGLGYTSTLPSLHMYFDGEGHDISQYLHGDGLVQYFRAIANPVVSMIEDKVAKTAYLSHSHGPKVVGYFSKIEFSPSDPKSKSAAAEFADFQKASRFFSPDVPFRLVTDPKVAKSFGFKSAPSVGVFRPMQHAAILPSSASLSYRSIRAFVEASPSCSCRR